MVECEEHHYLNVSDGMDMNTYGPVFAWCTTDEGDEEEGKWQYTEEDFSCDGTGP